MNKEQIAESAEGSEKPFKLGKLLPIEGNDPCVFSKCGRYRYTLWRQWGNKNDPYLNVIGLNPSTADDAQDDPTIRRCIGFAKSLGFAGLAMTNIFGWRDTLPKNMKAERNPIQARGTIDNDKWIRIVAWNAGMVIAAWGQDGDHMGRGREVLKMLRVVPTGRKAPAMPGYVDNPVLLPPQIMTLALNRDGTPKHPLYIKADTIPQPYLDPVLFAA